MVEVAQIQSFTEFDAFVPEQQIATFEYSDMWQFSFLVTKTYKGEETQTRYYTSGYKIQSGTVPTISARYYPQWKEKAIEYVNKLKQISPPDPDIEYMESEPSTEMTTTEIKTETDWRKNPDKESKKKELENRLNNMSDEDKSMFMKILQFDFLLEVFEAIKNLKKTGESTWKSIINKGQNLQNINIKDVFTKFDFNAFLKILLPLLAALAALLIGLRQSDGAEIESADVPNEDYENDPLTVAIKKKETGELPDVFEDGIDPLTGKLKSVVMTLCEKELKGFSL